MDLSNKIVALGQQGSALGYYLPLYDLYGLTLAEIIFASTPKKALELLQENKIDAAALSEEEFRFYQKDFPQTTFRILHRTKPIPPGAVLLTPKLDVNQQERIIEVMKNAPPNIALDTNYLPQAPVPDYEELMKIINKVKPLEAKIRQKPVILSLE
jgi:phosphonate transport system substrate-binding protein